MTFGWSWLSCIQHLPCSVSFQFMFGGSVEVWLKNILYWFIMGETHFGMPRGAERSLALNEPRQITLHSIQNTISRHAPQVKINYWCCMQATNWKSYENKSQWKVPTKNPIELKAYSDCGDFTDDGGGMSPDGIRQCMSLGYSRKNTNATIGQCKQLQMSHSCLCSSLSVWSMACRKHIGNHSILSCLE